MFRVSQHPSSAVLKAFSTPVDGCCEIRNMYSNIAENKYLHTAHLVEFLLTWIYDTRKHKLKILFDIKFFLPYADYSDTFYYSYYL